MKVWNLVSCNKLQKSIVHKDIFRLFNHYCSIYCSFGLLHFIIHQSPNPMFVIYTSLHFYCNPYPYFQASLDTTRVEFTDKWIILLHTHSHWKSPNVLCNMAWGNNTMFVIQKRWLDKCVVIVSVSNKILNLFNVREYMKIWFCKFYL